MKKKTIFETKNFNIIEFENSITGINFTNINIGILPYVVYDNKLISIGISKEKNFFREEQETNNIITGINKLNETFLESAIRIFKEKTGIEEKNKDKWLYLGILKLSKNTDESIVIFGLDISNYNLKELETNNFKLLKVNNEFLMSEESLLLATYFRLNIFFKKKINKILYYE